MTGKNMKGLEKIRKDRKEYERSGKINSLIILYINIKTKTVIIQLLLLLKLECCCWWYWLGFY